MSYVDLDCFHISDASKEALREPLASFFSTQTDEENVVYIEEREETICALQQRLNKLRGELRGHDQSSDQ